MVNIIYLKSGLYFGHQFPHALAIIVDISVYRVVAVPVFRLRVEIEGDVYLLSGTNVNFLSGYYS
jgi:hypothetical protein